MELLAEPPADDATRLRGEAWERLLARSPTLAWFAFLVVLAFSLSVLLIDPFGTNDVTQAASRALVERVIAPWYPIDADEPAAVVLILPSQEQPQAGWPPPRATQFAIYRDLLALCPRSLMIDIVYSRPRPDQTEAEAAGELQTLVSDLARARDRLQEDCDSRRGPAIYFAQAGLDPQPSLLAEALDRLEPEADWVSSLQRYANGGDLDAEPGALPSRPSLDGFGLANITWLPKERRCGAEIASVDLTQFYGLLGFAAADLGTGREDGCAYPSLALAAYLEHCARSRECRGCTEDSDCGSSLRELSLAATTRGERPWLLPRPEDGAIDEKAGALHELFAAPMHIHWRRWVPPLTQAYFIADRDAPEDPAHDEELAGVRGCDGPVSPGPLTRARESASLLWLGFWREKERSQTVCYPIDTIPARVSVREIADEHAVGPAAITYEAQLPDGLADVLRDRTLFVSLVDLSRDAVVSPVNGSLPGVFWHAMAFDNLVREGPAYDRAPLRQLHLWEGWSLACSKVVGVAEILLLAALIPWARRRLLLGRATRLRRAVDAPDADLLGLAARAFLLSGSTTVLLSLATLTFSIAVAMMCHFAFHWAVNDWISVSLLGALPAMVAPRRARST